MRARRRRRLYLVGLVLIGVGAAVGLTLNAFNQNLMFFYSPSEIAAGEAPRGRMIRLGGLVAAGSVTRQPDGLTMRFEVTDQAQTVTVEYTGILPDLFREGQGVVAHGRLDDHSVFVAEEVLARHDENYMPPEVADSLQATHEAGLSQPVPETAVP